MFLTVYLNIVVRMPMLLIGKTGHDLIESRYDYVPPVALLFVCAFSYCVKFMFTCKTVRRNFFPCSFV